MNYAEELAATRAVLEEPSIGASSVAELDTLHRLIRRYPAEARAYLRAIETS